MQVAQDGPPLGDEQTTAGLAVEPMHELELLELGMHRAQRFDHAETDPAAAVHSDARGLIDDDQVAIFEDHRSRDELPQRLRGRLRAVGVPLLFGSLDRRQPDAVAGDHPVGGLGPSAVYPHLPGPQDAVDQAARYRAERAHQEIVETLAVVPFLGLHVADC